MPPLFLPFIRSNNPTTPPPIPPEIEQIGFGVGIPWQLGESDPAFYEKVLAALNPPWWYNWQFDQIAHPDYLPMFWRPQKGQVWDTAVAAANAYPDREWLLYNEPERGESLADPVKAASLVSDWVKETSGKFSLAGLLTSVDGVGWLERYLDAGGPLPTSWHFHIYGYGSGNEWIDGLEGQTFIKWYKQFGAGLPVLISETNSNVNQSVEEQAILMIDIFLLLEIIPIVRGVGWYSAYDVFERWPWSNLIDKEGRLTELGSFYSERFGKKEEA